MGDGDINGYSKPPIRNNTCAFPRSWVANRRRTHSSHKTVELMTSYHLTFSRPACSRLLDSDPSVVLAYALAQMIDAAGRAVTKPIPETVQKIQEEEPET